MSNARFSIIQSRAVSDDRITNAQFRTLSALGIYGDKNGWCFPKLKTLGDMLGKSKQAVSMDIKALVELGYIEVKKQYRDDGSQQNNLYRILFDGDDDRGSDQLNGGLSPGVDGGLSSELNGGLSPGVDALTPHDNDPINAPFNGGSPLTIISNVGWVKICELYKLPVGVFETMLNGKQQTDIKSLLEKDAEKCVKIAVYYNNMGDTFVRMVGRIINNFDTWKTDSKKEQRRMEIL